MISCILWRQRLRNLSTSLFNLPRASLASTSSCINRSGAALGIRNVLLHYPLGQSGSVRSINYRAVNLVLSDGQPRFDSEKVEPSKTKGYLPKKRFKRLLKQEKQKRRAANKNDPCHLTPKGKKKLRFLTPADRIKYRLEKAKLKESLLVEKLKNYEIPRAHSPEPEPSNLTGEERHYLKKVAQKYSNYVPIGRRGIFGGVILNMHLHWKKHETVKVICKSKPRKPGIIQQYASELARLSGGVPVQVIGDHTIVFYRGKDYEQPDIMSPVDTLSKKKALQKSKYEQSLETVRRFISVSEKELELYYRHVELYGGPKSNNADIGHGEIEESPSGVNVDGLGHVKENGCCMSGSELSEEYHDDEASPDDFDVLHCSEAEDDYSNETYFSDEVDYLPGEDVQQH